MHQDRLKETSCTFDIAAKALGVPMPVVAFWAEVGVLEKAAANDDEPRVARESLLSLMGNPLLHARVVGRGLTHAPAAEAVRVLVVEDDLTLRRFYQVRLATWECRPAVRVAENGFDALLQIGIDCPDLLITDLDMPEIDGFALMDQLARSPLANNMAIVVVTGMSSVAADRLPSLHERVTVLRKPVPFEVLRRIAESRLSARFKIRSGKQYHA